MGQIPVIHDNGRDERGRNLEAAGFNGLRMGIVDLAPTLNPTEAHLELFLLSAVQRDPIRTNAVFTVRGGRRLPAGSAVGQVQVTSVANGSADDSLLLTIAPIGDYSTYVLSVTHPRIDPFFGELAFRFRPGCFTGNCAPEWEKSLPPLPQPVIDYLAKDYDSFRHTLMTAMADRVPGWRSTSEADLDQVLIDLLAAAADELSDQQDRVLNERYMTWCRKRVSLARHARLVDYNIHQCNQASTWLALSVTDPVSLPSGFRFQPTHDIEPMLEVWTGGDERRPGSITFAAHEPASFNPLLNDLRFYTWDDAVVALDAGSTSADLVPDTASPVFADAQAVVDLIRGTNPAVPPVRHLVLQEHLNPATGQAPGRSSSRRQLLRLVQGPRGAEVVRDPVQGRFLVRVHWVDQDRLRQRYCFTSFCPTGPATDISMFHGNVVRVHEGRVVITSFQEPGSDPPVNAGHRYETFSRTDRWGTLCHLPDAPLAYLAGPVGGEEPPVTTLHVEVSIPGGGSDRWDEVISLVHSDDSAENGDHFAVETDERQLSLLRFGNGVNGRALPTGAAVHCAYQVGGGVGGNVGFDTLTSFDRTMFPEIDRCWNPFDVTDGRNREPAEKVLRNAPEAYRIRQLRAVTLGDYVRRAEEVEGVSRASARYQWTGSWRTVRIAIDPVGTTELTDDVRRRVARHLEAVRLIGEDLEIRAPRFVPLEIHVAACLHPEYWPEDLRFVLEQEFSDGFTPDGRMGFFHPDRWTFGRALHRSEIEGRVHQVRGIEHIQSITMERFNEPGPAQADASAIEARPEEIFLVVNDPDHMEQGFIRFSLDGGRR